MDMFYTLNCRGRLLTLDRPRIMGILNLTPDSFSDGGQFNSPEAALQQVGNMLTEGADIIDIGGYSSRPYAIDISPEEELNRIYDITALILKEYPEAIISIDTFRSKVAEEMLRLGVHIINDISGGELDPMMPGKVAAYENVPYIVMHMQGRPQNMQENPTYNNIVEEVWAYFVKKINQMRNVGIKDLIIDPGFGFGKSIAHNYRLLHNLERLAQLEVPVLAGVSRKSMMYRLFDTTPDDVLELTSVLHHIALRQGVNILRTHDVRPAGRIVQLFTYFQEHGII